MVGLALMAGAALAADAVPHFRAPEAGFATVSGAASQPLGGSVLSEAERAFIAALPEVRVALTARAMPPFERIEADGLVTGIHPEMLTALGRAFGIRMRPVVYPTWSAALQAVRLREADLLMTLGVTPERLQYLEFTLGATPRAGALFGRRDAPQPPLESATFVLERDYLANDHVRRQYPRARIVTAESTREALEALAAGHADYYLGSLLEALHWLERSAAPGVVPLRALPHGTGHYHFAVRKDWAPLAGILNKGVQTLRARPNEALNAALAAVAPMLRPPQPLRLRPDAADVLLRRPLWRVGAVRGLVLLNDVDDNGTHSGIAAEYTEQVARRLGVAVQVVAFDNVATMLEGLRAGAIDLVPFLTRTPEREREFAFAEPYIEMPYMLVARSDGPLYWGLDSLRGRRLALALAHPLRELLARRYADIHIVDAANGNEAMNLVADGSADAAVEVKLFANLRINADLGARLRTVSTVEELPAQFHFAASKAAAELLPLVNQALADIDAAERQRMLRRWVAVDLQPPFPWQRYLPLLAVAAAALLAVAGLTLWWMRRLSREVAARRRSERLLNDVATTVPGVAFRYVVDPDGRLRHRFVSPSAAAFLGVELEPGRTLLQSLVPHAHPDQREAALARERACAVSHERFKLTALFQLPGARPRWLHSEAVHSAGEGGRSVWTGYIVDVSSERELQARLEQEAGARNLLLAAASHELRAPTHNLSLALQSIDAGALPGPVAAALRIARRAAHTLTQLLNDVLDAARFDTGPLRLRPTAFALHELVEEQAEAWGVVARDKGLAFHHRVAADVPALVTMDPLRLKQILINLLSNACKYTVAGRVDLEVSVESGGLCLAVSDTGPGLAEAVRSRLFQPYTAGSTNGAGAPAGGSTGLGLMVCHNIAAAMGGRIDVESRPGQGTRFVVHLPLPGPREGAEAATGAATEAATEAAPSDRAAEPAAAAVVGAASAESVMAAPADAPPAGGCVVVCDDDAVSRILTAQILRLRGYRVVETADGASALAAWRDGDVRALITDLDMPGLQGRELIRVLRAEEARAAGAAPRTWVVVCSGHPLPAEGDAASFVPGCDAYLLKPVDMDCLARTLAEGGVRPASTPAAATAALDAALDA
ncbi:MAG: transporter substrate-binding domain-containing protein [Burkholderiales bacterium]|nr:transporter substrate-binding domain-containing protein [Burkholderiales bacterium]